MQHVTVLASETATTLLPLRSRDSWQQQLQDAVRDPVELAQALGLSLEDLGYDIRGDRQFPLLVPHAFVRRMECGNPRDPLLLQVLPVAAESEIAPGFGPDPVGEMALPSRDRGVLSKYRGRSLMIATGQCAVNCRYCFRRHYPYSESATSSRERLALVRELGAEPGQKELILSGGDPLLLSDKQLRDIAETLVATVHLETLRIHTRLPIVIPERVTTALLDALALPGLQTVVVLHSNHAREIDSATAQAIAQMRDSGVTVLNQAVLLEGINDDPRVLAELGDALFSAGALPYYLHLLDKVAGAAHFDIPRERAQRIVGELATLRPGYLVPRLVEEIAGAESKRVLAPLYPRGATENL